MAAIPVTLGTRPPTGVFGVVPPTASPRSLPIVPPVLPPSAPILPSSVMTLKSSATLPPSTRTMQSSSMLPTSTRTLQSSAMRNLRSSAMLPAPTTTLQSTAHFTMLPGGSGFYPVQAPLDEGPSLQEPEEPEPVKEPIFDYDAGASNSTLFLFSLFVAALIVIIPLWDGITLLHDPVWVYMCGTVLPLILISAVVVVILLFTIVLTTLLFCRNTRVVRQEQTVLNVAVLFVLLLGTIFVTMSPPIIRRAEAAQVELMFNCKTGVLSQPLYHAYENLQTMRKKSACAGMFSVEKCAGYDNSSSLNYIIKGMEQRMQCSGFCFVPKAGSSANATSVNAANVSYGYPAALFSTAGMQGSCSAMAARDMGGFAQDMGTRLEWEGYFLMAAAVVQGFLLIGGSCVKRELARRKYNEEKFVADDYGTIPAFMGSEAVRKRY